MGNNTGAGVAATVRRHIHTSKGAPIFLKHRHKNIQPQLETARQAVQLSRTVSGPLLFPPFLGRNYPPCDAMLLKRCICMQRCVARPVAFLRDQHDVHSDARMSGKYWCWIRAWSPVRQPAGQPTVTFTCRPS
jgi:hypothetical protein